MAETTTVVEGITERIYPQFTSYLIMVPPRHVPVHTELHEFIFDLRQEGGVVMNQVTIKHAEGERKISMKTIKLSEHGLGHLAISRIGLSVMNIGGNGKAHYDIILQISYILSGQVSQRRPPDRQGGERNLLNELTSGVVWVSFFGMHRDI